MKLEKLSNYALLGCIVVGIICFGLFYVVDYSNMDFDGVHVSPKLTDLILGLMYILLGITACLTVWSVIRSAAVNSGNSGPSPTGIPGNKITLCVWGCVIITLIIGLVLGLGEEPFTTVSGKTTSGGMVTVVDMFLIAIYILAIVTVAAVVVSMSGALTKSATPKE